MRRFGSGNSGQDRPCLDDSLASAAFSHHTGVRYAAAEGMHDDGVCALALAVKHYEWMTHRPSEIMFYTGRDEIDADGQPDNWLERHVLKYGSFFPGDFR